MKEIERIFRFIFTIDFFSILVAMLSLNFLVTVFAVSLKPEKFGDTFQTLFSYSIVSFLSFYLLLRPIEYYLFAKFPIKFMWFVIIILGTLLFTYLFTKSVSMTFSGFFSFLAVALIPSATLRFTLNFAINYWQERQELSKFSIVK